MAKNFAFRKRKLCSLQNHLAEKYLVLINVNKTVDYLLGILYIVYCCGCSLLKTTLPFLFLKIKRLYSKI